MRHLLLLLALAAGCADDPPKQLGGQCDLTSQCEAPLVCRIARCRKECASTRDCPVGQLCALDDDGLGACLLVEETRCARHSDCPGSLSCIAGRCTHECEEDRDCAPGASCVGVDDGMPRCEDPADRSCARNSDCDGELTCAADGRCRLPCRADRDCREGSACEDGLCVPFEADAGTPLDAGPPDAGTPDAEAPGDGGEDAGGEDAAVASDAGEVVVTCTLPADCRAPRVTGADCVSGLCVATSCEATWADCDGDFATGCEADTTSDPDHCGGCGTWCGAGGTCSASTCDGVVGVTLGQNHSCYLRTAGRVVCMGYDSDGALGGGERPTGTAIVDPVEVLGLGDAAQIENGTSSSCAVRRTGEMVCWGENGAGQLGDGTFTNRLAPRAVVGITNAVQVSMGYQHACAVLSGGGLYCWGNGTKGAVGNGATGYFKLPVPVTGIGDAVHVACGDEHCCAARATGAVSCWGRNHQGQLGDGTGGTSTDQSATPVAVTGITDAVAVSAGTAHSCAVHGTGAVSCWGSNGAGALGTGMTVTELTRSLTPLPVTGLTNAVTATSGSYHTCAITTTGAVACWGEGSQGELGDGLGTSSAVPVYATGLADAVSLAAYEWCSCAIRSGERVVCWGNNELWFGVDRRYELWLTPDSLPSTFP